MKVIPYLIKSNLSKWQYFNISFVFFQSESRVLLSKLVQKYPPEIDASHLQKILRGHWKVDI